MNFVNGAQKKGVDVSFKKINMDEENCFDSIPQDTNFFISQSAIEHLKYDLKFFKDVKST